MSSIGRQSCSQLYQRDDEIDEELEPDHEYEMSTDLDTSERDISEVDDESLPSI